LAPFAFWRWILKLRLAYQPSSLNSLLKNAVLAFFNLAKFGAKLLTARKIATYGRYFGITSV